MLVQHISIRQTIVPEFETDNGHSWIDCGTSHWASQVLALTTFSLGNHTLQRLALLQLPWQLPKSADTGLLQSEPEKMKWRTMVWAVLFSAFLSRALSLHIFSCLLPSPSWVHASLFLHFSMQNIFYFYKCYFYFHVYILFFKYLLAVIISLSLFHLCCMAPDKG